MDRWLDTLWEYVPPSLQRQAERYIHPASRKPLAVIACIIVALLFYRFYLKGRGFHWGRLPGVYEGTHMCVMSEFCSVLPSIHTPACTSSSTGRASSLHPHPPSPPTGDFTYSAPGVYVSFPLASCVIFSAALHLIQRVWRL